MTLYDTYTENVRRGGAYLGVVFDRQHPREAIVQTVNPDSPADAAGLRRGDMIVGVNGRDVRSYQEVIDEIDHSSPGDEIEIAVADGDRTQTLVAELDSRPTTTRYQVAKPTVGGEVRTAQPVPTDDYRYDRRSRRAMRRSR